MTLWLVFGTGLALPNVLDDAPSGLKANVESETFAMHLYSLNAARISFNRSVADSKIKVALKKKVRSNNTVFYPGDDIYYKRHHEADWRKGKVLSVENKVLWVRNGKQTANVHVNMAIKAPFLFNDNNVQEIPVQNRFSVLEQEDDVEKAAADEMEEMILQWEDHEENPFRIEDDIPAQQADVDDVADIEDPPVVEDLVQDTPEVVNNQQDVPDNDDEQDDVQEAAGSST